MRREAPWSIVKIFRSHVLIYSFAKFRYAVSHHFHRKHSSISLHFIRVEHSRKFSKQQPLDGDLTVDIPPIIITGFFLTQSTVLFS